MPDNHWRQNITKFCNKLEKVFKQRNVACHTPPILEDGAWLFQPVAAAKFLKKLDLKAGTIQRSTLNDFKVTIGIGEAAIGEGLNLLENFKRARAEVRK